MPFPDFLGIGAQRSGTDWLSKNLRRHPDIWMPPLKELHYFDQRIKEPSFGALVARLLGKKYTDDWYHRFWRGQFRNRSRQHRKKFDPQTALWDFRFFMRSPSDRWYASLFEQEPGKITGEITPDYSILEEEVVAHIHKLMPNTKVIFLMRNPMERTYSATVRHLRLKDQRTEAITDEQLFEGSNRPGVRSFSNYLHILEKWRRFYPDDQIFIGFLEDIYFHPARLLRRLYGFLGVDASHARKALRRKVHTYSPEQMPTRVAAHLARTYHEDLQRLSALFGGYASFWLYCAERLANDTIGEDAIPYPLCGSRLWEEWIKECGSFTRVNPQDGEVQSRSLA